MATRRPRGRPAFADILTPAEWRVAEAVRHGLSNRTIASRRGISIDAVKYHVANILLKLTLSNRRELQHWTGIARESALFSKETAVDEQLKIGVLGQIARSVNDLEAARRWYGEVLGLMHLYTFGNLSFFDCGGVRLLLEAQSNKSQPQSILYFRVADIQTAYTVLASRGAEFVGAPHMIHRHEDGTEEWMAFFNDNEGRPLAIMAQVQP